MNDTARPCVIELGRGIIWNSTRICGVDMVEGCVIDGVSTTYVFSNGCEANFERNKESRHRKREGTTLQCGFYFHFQIARIDYF